MRNPFIYFDFSGIVTQIRRILEEFVKFQRSQFKSSNASLAKFILDNFESYLETCGMEIIEKYRPEMADKMQTSRFHCFSLVYDESVLSTCLKCLFSGDYYEGPRIVYTRFITWLAESAYISELEQKSLKIALSQARK